MPEANRNRWKSSINKLRQNKLPIALVALVWLFLYVGTFSNRWFHDISMGDPFHFSTVLLSLLIYWIYIALFAFLIYKLTLIFPLDTNRKTIARNALVHILFFAFFILTQYQLYLGTHYLILEPAKFNDWLLNFELFSTPAIQRGIILVCLYLLIVIAVHLDRYHKRFKKRQLLTARLQAELSAVSLSVLQNQLRPHFLFNTLHNINALMHDDPVAAKKMLALLKRLLRRSFQHTKLQTVTLAEELDFTNIYFRIENVRFYNGLNVQQEIESDTLPALVPSLLLQPLAENAVRHGIAQKTTAGSIYLRSNIIQNKLQLVIEDSGPGIMNKNPTFKNGIGLKNTQKRLEHMYEEYRFELLQSDYGGLKVLIEIPFSTQ